MDIYMILAIILAVYEIAVRVIPTQGNWSILHFIVNAIDLILKNHAKKESGTTGTFKVGFKETDK